MSKPTPTTRKSAFIGLVPLYIGLIILFAILIKRGNLQLLEPAGYIADIQSRLLWGALIFAALVGSSVVITFFFIVFRYRENGAHRYDPSWTAGKKLLIAGWGVPLVAVAAISVLVWNTAHLVDPYRPISSSVAPITIQVVALRWKWLFIYPNDRIATVNMMEIPTGTPIALQLTADAPMNSFWVPRLSGQVYAMTGMVTQLHIEADKPGVYNGSPAEMSGDGFAGMRFTVTAVPNADFNNWKARAGNVSQTLDYAAYARLAQPSSYVQPATYTLPNANLFHDIVMQYMEPGSNQSALYIRGESM